MQPYRGWPELYWCPIWQEHFQNLRCSAGPEESSISTQTSLRQHKSNFIIWQLVLWSPWVFKILTPEKQWVPVSERPKEVIWFWQGGMQHWYVIRMHVCGKVWGFLLNLCHLICHGTVSSSGVGLVGHVFNIGPCFYGHRWLGNTWPLVSRAAPSPRLWTKTCRARAREWELPLKGHAEQGPESPFQPWLH